MKARKRKTSSANPKKPLPQTLSPLDEADVDPVRSSLDYIVADLWAETLGRSKLPQGYRGYIVLSTGNKWARLFSPVSLECHRMKLDDFDTVPRRENVLFDPPAMLQRVQERRAQCRRHGTFDGGKAADQAEGLLIGLDT